jgi:hypothetical protein
VGIQSFFPERIETIDNVQSANSRDPSAGRLLSHGAIVEAAHVEALRGALSLLQKAFARARPSTKVNPHKDGYGNRCYGGHGYLL